MEIKQKRNSNRVRYEFGDDTMHYSIEDGSGSRSFALPYAEISRDRQTLEERNLWLRNVGLLWIGLGMALTAVSLFGDSPARSMWVPVGAVCYGIYWFRRTRFTILPSEKGNLLVIDDAEGPRILEQIETRRAAQLRREYDFLDHAEDPAQVARRFNWLHREGALSNEELRERLDKVRGSETPALSKGAEERPRLLN